jgi:hypothetical protein
MTAPTTTTELTEREAIRRYAADLKEASWCVDTSSSPVRLLHAASNHEASIEHFRYEFTDWARENNLRVATEGFAAFMASLPQRVASKLPRILGSSFLPLPGMKTFKHNGVTYANTYKPFIPEGLPDKFVMPAILDEYLSRVFMNDDDRLRITQWMADIVQNPARRPQWAVVLTGDQGTGKSSISRLVKAALGGRHTWEDNDYTPAFKQFSEVLPDNLLVCFDDVPATTRADHYQKLKQAITCDSQSVELKGIQKPVQRQVFARVLVCSNHPRPLKIEEGDRRLYVAQRSEHKVSPEDSKEFFVLFNAWLEQPGTPAILYHWLKSVDLGNFVAGSTVQTETHTQMVGLSASVLVGLLAEYVQPDDNERQPIFHIRSLLDYLAANEIRNPNLDAIKLKLAGLKYEPTRRKVPGCGDKQVPGLWQPSRTRGQPLTKEEAETIRRVYVPDFQNP